jgi:hypothetical protein
MPGLQTWYVIVAILLFAGLIGGVVWLSRKRSRENPGSLHLGG